MSLEYNINTYNYLLTKEFYEGFTKIFPKDICEVILEWYFGRIARIKWYNSSIHDDIKDHAHGRFTSWILHNSSRIGNSDQNILTFLKDNKRFLKQQIPIAINWYYDCRCCQRHQVHKPCICNMGYGDELCIVTKPEAFLHSWGLNNNCQCQCRHNARWLARSWLQIVNLEKERGNDILRDHHLFRRFR